MLKTRYFFEKSDEYEYEYEYVYEYVYGDICKHLYANARRNKKIKKISKNLL